MSGQLTGGLVNYYLATVTYPQREEQPAYVAECEDIITALKMDFNEACEFKAIWRTAAARLGNGKPGQKALYDAEKRLHYAGRSVRELRLEQEAIKADGWVQQFDGRMPFILRGDEVVEVELADGSKPPPRAAQDWCWTKASESSAIIKWRMHNHVV
jgi:hypothetical protein